MANILEYTFSLQDKYSSTLEKIGVNNNLALEKFAKLEQQSVKVRQGFTDLGRNITTLSSKLALLRDERDMLPADSVSQIKIYNKEINKLEKEITKLQTVKGGALSRWFGELKSSLPIIGQITNPIALASAGIYKLNSYIAEGKDIYAANAVQLSKLTQIMGNTMNATEADVDAVKRLMDAQQKMGVISADVQSGGVQELATYLERRDSLEKLIPVMNDMTAQQYGLNATQEQSQQIASMMGKVMDGQVGALSRYGYKFTEAQEQILKYGTESERAATLAEVVSQSVGGVNEALRNTPEGKAKALADEMEDFKARIGGFVIQIQTGFLEFKSKLLGVFSSLMDKIEPFQQQIIDLAGMIGDVLGFALDSVISIVTGVIDVFLWLSDEISDNIILFGGIAVAIGVFTIAVNSASLALKIKAMWDGIAATTTGIFTGAITMATGAFAAFSAVVKANPIMAVISSVIALIGVIVWLVSKVTGWGEAWDHTVKGAKLAFLAYVEYVKWSFDTLVNGIMIGIDKIKLGWYKFKNAVGIGDKNANNDAIAKINADTESRKKAIVDGAKKVKDLAVESGKEFKLAAGSLKLKESSEKTTGKATGVKTSSDLMEELSAPGNAMGKNQNGEGNEASKTNESIATGGTKNTTINITMKSMVELIQIMKGNGFKESAQDMEEEVTDALLRSIAMASSTAG